MTRLDLQRVVPDPPDDLLGWPTLNARIRRRRAMRKVTAVVGAAAIIAGGVTLGLSVNDRSPQPPATIIPTPHADGPILLTRKLAGSPSYLPLTALYAVGSNGRGTATRITEQSGGLDQVAASPDGRRIAYTEQTYGRKPGERYVNGEYVHVADADGSDDQSVYRCVSSACGELSWSPDGRRLLFTDNRTHILEPDGHVMTLCAGECPGDSPFQVSWSPDGRQLAFQSGVTVALHNGQSGPGGYSSVAAIGVMDADGSDPKLLTELSCSASNVGGCADDTGPIWSPDGTSIAFVRTQQSYLRPNNSHGGISLEGDSEQLDTIRPDGTGLQTTWQCAHCTLVTAAWSPVGNRVAFVSDDYENDGRREVVNLHIADIASGLAYTIPLRDLSHVIGEFAPSLVWSPSGRRLLLGGAGRGIPRGVSLVRVTARRIGQPHPLGSSGFAPIGWLPRG